MASFAVKSGSVRDTILAYFRSSWSEITPISYNNIDHNKNFKSDFVRIILRPSTVGVAALGESYFRNTGVVFVQIFAVSDKSTYNLDTYVDRVTEILCDTQLDGNITLRDCEINYTGVSQETHGAFYQANISALYYYDTKRV